MYGKITLDIKAPLVYVTLEWLFTVWGFSSDW